MLTVRFPNGQAIQYNTANHVIRRDRYTDLYTHPEGKGWIAQVSNDCAIEAVPACRVYLGTDETRLRALEGEIGGLRREVRRLIRKVQK